MRQYVHMAHYAKGTLSLAENFAGLCRSGQGYAFSGLRGDNDGFYQ